MARKSAGLSQDELAEKVDVSRSSLANVERGVQRVMLHQAIEMSKALNVPLQTLIQPVPEPKAVEALRSQGMDDLGVLDWVHRASNRSRSNRNE